MVKAFLNAFHDLVKGALHVILIPVVAALKAIITGLTHVLGEIEKL